MQLEAAVGIVQSVRDVETDRPDRRRPAHTNTGTAAMSDKILAAVRQLVNAPPTPNQCFGVNCPGTLGWSSPFINNTISSPTPAKPLRYIINTSAAPEHVGGDRNHRFFPSWRRIRRGNRKSRANGADHRA